MSQAPPLHVNELVVALASTIIQSKDIHMQKRKRKEKKRKMGTSRKLV
jgi:hypothetical protein